MRSIPPVLSAYPFGAILRATREARAHPVEVFSRLSKQISTLYPGYTVSLVDSGTSALALALAASETHASMDRAESPVAVPAYCCPDIGTALQQAGLRGVAYDTDPNTLSPDLASLERCLQAGCKRVVVAHLFGYPVDLPAVRATMAPFGALLIEDAAQHAGGRLDQVRLGNWGDLSILSFGRGKGLNGMGGGALLRSASFPGVLPTPPRAGGTLRTAAVAVAMQLVTHPTIYGAFASLPWLRIGETLYHEPCPPRPINGMSAALLETALRLEHEALRTRRAWATSWDTALAASDVVTPIRALPQAEPGFLRFPVRLSVAPPATSTRVGIARAYPRTLLEYEPLHRTVYALPGETLAGARELAARLWTLPTHGGVITADQQTALHLLSNPRR
jgi:dTDP-4-amino-4,6-dideoxygalactose transaminase